MRFALRSALLVLILLRADMSFAQAPVANFVANLVTGCNPLCVTFTSTSTGSNLSYNWNLGNGTLSSQVNPQVCYTQPGTYTVSLTVTNSNGSNTKTINNYITVLPGPTVAFSLSPTAGCPPLAVNFTNSSTSTIPGGLTYQWIFGDGTPPVSQQNPTHTYNFPQLFPATLYVTDAQGCQNNLTHYVDVYTPPSISFSAPASPCDVPAVVNFSSNIGGTPPYSYQWDFGDGGAATTANPTHTYIATGAYTVRLIVTDGHGCKDTLTKNNYINVGSLNPNFAVNTGCEGTPLHFVNTSNLSDSVLWKFGDGGKDTSGNPDHIYQSSGTFNVTLIVHYSSCVDSIIKPVTINPKPNAAYTFSPLHPCPPPSTIQFINQTTGATSYKWYFDDGDSSLLSNPTHTYLNDTAFFPKLIAISNQGCADTSWLDDTVAIYPMIFHAWCLNPFECIGDTASFNYSTGSFNIFASPNTTRTYPYPVTSFYWDFGDGGTATISNPKHYYSTRGNHRASLTITTANGCTFTDTVLVQVGLKPTASFTFSPDTVCNHGTVTCVNTSTNASWYLWDFGNGGNYTDTTGGIYTYTYEQSGIDTIVLFAMDYGCSDTFTANRPIVVHPPTALFQYLPRCSDPTYVDFYDTVSIEPTSHWWSFGDGDTTSATNPVHHYPSLGTYTVSLYTYNSIYGCTDTMTKVITLVDPVLTVTTPDTAICEGDSIVFTPSYIGSQLHDYYWRHDSFSLFYPFPPYPDRNKSTGPWGYRFNQKGIYVINVVAADELKCVDTAWITVLVAKPDAGFTATPQIGCVPSNVTFLDTSTNVPGAYDVVRKWDFGNGTGTALAASTNHLYPVKGWYNVQLIVTDNVGCMDTVDRPNYIEVRQPSAAFVVNDSNACRWQTLSFTNLSQGTHLTSQWFFGDGATDTATHPSHAYTQTGSYTVKLVVTDDAGCKDSFTHVAYISITSATASFTVSDSLAICPPLSLQAINSSVNAIAYLWDLGNGASSSFQNPTASYFTPGVYTLRLIAANMEGCKDTAYRQVQVLGYSGALHYSPLSGCAPLTVGFKSQLFNIPSVIWDFSDGVTQPANGVDTATHTYTSPGAYVPRLILSDNTGCQTSSVGTDTIKVDGVYAGFVTSPACINTLITFTDTSFSFFSPLLSRKWNINNGQVISTSATAATLFPGAGVYPVTIVATNANGCKDSITRNLTVWDLPNIEAVSDTSICKGDAALLSVKGGSVYVWSPATGLSCTNCPNPVATPTSSAVYRVNGTDVHGCENKDTVKVTVQTITTSIAANGGQICQDSSIQLSASGAQAYAWTPGATLNDSSLSNPVARPRVTTDYRVIAREGSCLPDTHVVRVVVFPLPTVDAGQDVKIVAGSSTMLTAKGSNIETYQWTPAHTLSCGGCQNPTATPPATTLYKVVVMSEYGCRSYDSVLVSVLCDQSQLFIPNTFSPNGDGQNDIFYPRGVGLRNIRSFRIYNRWGEKVFERSQIQLNDVSQGWDGTYKGKELSPDVYVYIIEGECEGGEQLNWKGDVTMMR